MKDNFYVYLLLNPLKNKEPFYVGKGRKYRIQSSINNCKYNNIKFSIIEKIRKAGKEPIIEYYQTDLNEEDAFFLESELIAFYGRRDIRSGILSNMTDGGEGMAGHLKELTSIETRQKMSQAKKGLISVKDKEGNVFKIHKDDPRWISGELVGLNKNRKFSHSQETKTKIAIANTKRKYTQETKDKISTSVKKYYDQKYLEDKFNLASSPE